MAYDLDTGTVQDRYAPDRAITLEDSYSRDDTLYQQEHQTLHIEEDTSARALLGTDIATVVEMAEERGHAYAEQYLQQAVGTVADLFEDMGVDVTGPDIAYTPWAADQEDETPMARYDPSDDRIEVIRGSTDDDRPIDASLLGVLAHETWHKHMEERLRERFGFIGRERPRVARGFGHTRENGSYTGNAHSDQILTDSGYTAAGSSYHDLDGLDNIYGEVTDTVSMFDQLNDEELEVDETVPDVHLGGLDEALAHVITLTLDGGIDDPDLRRDYWERVEEKYDQHAEQHGIYDDRTGSFGGEIAVLGEYIASTVADMEGGDLDGDIERLGAVLSQEDRIIDQGLLSLEPEGGR